MIPGIEIPFALAFLYPALNLLTKKEKLKEIDNELIHEKEELEGIEMYGFEEKYNPPFTIIVGIVGVPIAGSNYKDTSYIGSSYVSKLSNKQYIKYYQLDSSTSTSYINTQELLNNTLIKFKISMDEYPFSLPLKMNYTHFKSGAYFHSSSGYMSGNKDRLVKQVLWTKRVPFTLTVPIIAGTCMCVCLVRYLFDKSYPPLYEKPYLPPFHPTRVSSYFK